MPVTVEIGSLCEVVEVLEEPLGKPSPRIGRIRHANGENVAIDHETLEMLMNRARKVKERQSCRDDCSSALYA